MSNTKFIITLQTRRYATVVKKIHFFDYHIPAIKSNFSSDDPNNIFKRMFDFSEAVENVDGQSKIWHEETNASPLASIWKSIESGDIKTAKYTLENSQLLDNGRAAAIYTRPSKLWPRRLLKLLELKRCINQIKTYYPVTTEDLGVVSNTGGAFGFMVNEKVVNILSARHTYDALTLAPLAENGTILEIGAGHGGLAAKCLQLGVCKKYIIVDLPMMLIVSFYFLSKAFPDLKMNLVKPGSSQEACMATISSSDVIFISSGDVDLIEVSGANVCFNSYSFSEMEEATVTSYLAAIEAAEIPFLLHENFDGDRNKEDKLLPVSKFKFKKFKKLQMLPMANPRNHSDCKRELYLNPGAIKNLQTQTSA